MPVAVAINVEITLKIFCFRMSLSATYMSIWS